MYVKKRGCSCWGFPWDSSEDEREALRKSYETRYEELKLKWVNDDVKRNTEF